MKRLDLYWLAGLLEGEAYFGIRKNRVKGHLYFYPEMQLQMCDHDVVKRVAKLLRATIYCYNNPRPRCQKWFRTGVTNSRAAALMRALYPLMGTRRRAKIREIIGPL